MTLINRHNTTRSKQRQRRGFALLLVVACILIISIAMVSLSRESLLIATEAADSVDALQQRWEQVSLERASIAAAIEIYEGDSKESNTSGDSAVPPLLPPKQHWLRCNLNGRDYHIVLSDESAKANILTLHQLNRSSPIDPIMATLSNGELKRVFLTNGESVQDSSQSIDLPRSWGEVIPIGGYQQDSISISKLPSVTKNLTIWGDGRTNVNRAEDQVLFEMSRLVISDSHSRSWIASYRENYPDRNLQQVLAEIPVQSKDLGRLRDRLSTQSTCLSAWVIRSGEQNAGHSVCVATRGGGKNWVTETTRFHW